MGACQGGDARSSNRRRTLYRRLARSNSHLRPCIVAYRRCPYRNGKRRALCKMAGTLAMTGRASLPGGARRITSRNCLGLLYTRSARPTRDRARLNLVRVYIFARACSERTLITFFPSLSNLLYARCATDMNFDLFQDSLPCPSHDQSMSENGLSVFRQSFKASIGTRSPV